MVFAVALLMVVGIAVVEGFTSSKKFVASRFTSPRALSASIQGIDTCGQFNFDSCFLLSAANAATEKGADYVYGSVAAPDWALPLGAVLVILTAALPILLKPGEAALDQQRENEAQTGSEFNKRNKKPLR